MNLFDLSGISADIDTETFDQLLSTQGVMIERIVSQAHASPEGYWYDQHWHEWVVILQGSAGVQIEGEPEARRLRVGDSLYLRAHHRHRVAWTDPDQTTIWLAVHIGKQADE